MAGVKQQARTARDANVPDPEKQCARRLAMALDAKLLAALIVLPHDRVELLKPAASTI
jgi:plasmid maintenance system killer protein